MYKMYGIYTPCAHRNRDHYIYTKLLLPNINYMNIFFLWRSKTLFYLLVPITLWCWAFDKIGQFLIWSTFKPSAIIWPPLHYILYASYCALEVFLNLVFRTWNRSTGRSISSKSKLEFNKFDVPVLQWAANQIQIYVYKV